MRIRVKTATAKAVQFAEVTKNLIRSGHVTRAKKCLDIAELLLKTGTAETKSVISNVYVFSVSTFMEVHHCSIANFFPASLKAEYIKQVNASGV